MIPPFELHRPCSLSDALALRTEISEDSQWLAGGTELLLIMKMGFTDLKHLIDIKRINALSEVAVYSDGSIAIGATVKYHGLIDHTLLKHAWPALDALISHIGNPRVRTSGTPGGNIAFAEPRSDIAIFLTAANSTVLLQSERHTREVMISDFITGPYTTAIGETELMVALKLPPPVAAGYRKFQVLERPSLGIAVVGDVQNGVFTEAPSVAIGGAGSAVTLPAEAASLLEGRPLSATDPCVRQAALAAAETLVAVSEPFASESYKRYLVTVMLPSVVASMSVPTNGNV